MKPYILSAILLTLSLLSGCSAQINDVATPTNTLTPTFTQTSTATSTPSLTPSPTITLTPSPTQIAGGNGKLVLSCNNRSGFHQGFIGSYDLTTNEYTPLSSELSRTKELVETQRILSQSPDGQILYWNKCDQSNMINAYTHYGKAECSAYLSNGSFTVNTSIPKKFEGYGIHVVSNRVVFLYEYEGDGFNRVFSPVNLYLLGMDENQDLDSKTTHLERLETAYPVAIEPSASGDFAVLLYATHTYVPETDRYKWNEWHLRIIDIEKKSLLNVDIHSNYFIGWINNDKFMYYDQSSSKFAAYDVRSMSKQEFEIFGTTISPDEQWMGYSESIGYKKTQITLKNTLDSSQIVIQEQSDINFFISWSPDSRHLVYASEPYTNYQQIKVYELETGKTTSLLDISVNSQPYKGYQSFSWSPDGSLFVIGIMKYEKVGSLEVADALDYFLCDFEKCTSVNPASATSCSNAIFTTE